MHNASMHQSVCTHLDALTRYARWCADGALCAMRTHCDGTLCALTHCVHCTLCAMIDTLCAFHIVCDVPLVATLCVMRRCVCNASLCVQCVAVCAHTLTHYISNTRSCITRQCLIVCRHTDGLCVSHALNALWVSSLYV